MAPPLSTQRPKPHDILGTLKARKKACGLVKGLVHLRKRLHDQLTTLSTQGPLWNMKWVFVTPFEYQSTILMVREKGSQHIKAIHRKRSFICVVCHEWFSEKGSQHIKAVQWKRGLYLWTGTGHQKVKLYLCEVCHGWFSEKVSQHIKAIHRKGSFICVKFATNGILRKEVSTSRQSTEREALFVWSLPRMVVWERKSAHQGNPLKEKLYLCEVCHE